MLNFREEKDSCGVGFVAHIGGKPSHRIVQFGLDAVVRLTHRGAVDADARTGDGAGILTALSFPFFAREVKQLGYSAKREGDFGVAVLFLPRQDPIPKERCRIIFEEVLSHFNLELIGFRPVPVDTSHLGDKAAEARPEIVHALVKKPADMDREMFERTLYIARREAELHVARKEIEDFYICSFSSRTIVYKGMFVAPQLQAFYLDLQDPLFASPFCIFHQRYSTNTFPNWQLAQPFRLLAHNGEINTLEGNRSWMRARQEVMESHVLGKALRNLFPVIQPNGSDSQSLDNVMELLVMAGRGILQAACMLVPEAWRNIQEMHDALKAFYHYQETILEPWDGPAALAFSDGRTVAACLDRNGLRPARYVLYEDDILVLGSEVGLIQNEESAVRETGRLGPGHIIAVDIEQGKLMKNHEIKEMIESLRPYRSWLANQLQKVPASYHESIEGIDSKTAQEKMPFFFYTKEDVQLILKPMAKQAKEPTWSMGDDTPLSFLSAYPRLLYTYFKQRFAQVTNPPIDSLREEIVMSLHTFVGPRLDFLTEREQHAHLIEFASPVITMQELKFLKNTTDPYFRYAEISCVYPRGKETLQERLQKTVQIAEERVREGKTVLIFTDRAADAQHIPLPMLLVVGAVHHYLIRQGIRMQATIVCESGEPREVHHFATLIGYGATLICPYLALEAVVAEAEKGTVELTPSQSVKNYLKAVDAGILKIMAKMGISTVSSYRGAQIFEAIGLSREVLAMCFPGTPCRIYGASFQDLEKDLEKIHQKALEALESEDRKLYDAGYYRYRKWGEYHATYPPAVKKLHQAVRENSWDAYREFSDLINHRPPTTLRDLLRFRKTRQPIPIDEVEPVEAIVKRFCSAAMSHGALSREAHETIAIAMNRLGGKSNSGEGGEDPVRYLHYPNGDWGNSLIKQVASGRFGVTPAYLASAREIEIKMAQGSKPGEGGQLPGHKVSEEIAKQRFSVPGVTLISPPPHHDIYSIEDLAQLIYDLKHANSFAHVCVKLVAIAGVGTIAAGVAKAYADVIHISGYDGGTGASPASSIKHAGVPWELGLAETQQVLVFNGLRGRVTLRVDGGFRTGRDVVVAAILGAEEFSFGTMAMIAEGCVMARQCHLNSCPVGVATQREELRKRFTGKPEHVVHYFRFVAQEVREILASLGYHALHELTGKVEEIEPLEIQLDRVSDADISFILADPDPQGLRPKRNKKGRNDRVDYTIDDQLIQCSREAIVHGREVELEMPVENTQRAIGTKLSAHITYYYGYNPMPGAIHVRLHGTAGQSFGAFLAAGITLCLHGYANDYVGKGMGGGEIIIRSPKDAHYLSSQNVIAGNTCFYGATGGQAFLAGEVGERFCVRNSGAKVVVEGVGDHGCEYMTGGTVLVLGPCGKNFGAGMTGGTAYVLDEQRTFSYRVNFQIVNIEQVQKQEDIEVIKTLLEEHFRKTESAKAKQVLERFEETLPLFWKVVPPLPQIAEARSTRKLEAKQE